MTAETLTTVKANFDLTLMNADADAMSSSDLYIWLRESGLPSEVAIRLYDLVDTVKEVGKQVINIGKIILLNASYNRSYFFLFVKSCNHNINIFIHEFTL